MSSRRSFLSLLTVSPLALLVRARANPERMEAGITLVPIPRREPGRIAPWAGDPETLGRWRRAPRRLVLESFDETSSQLLHAIRIGSSVDILYDGGSLQCERRTIAPGALFEVEGFSGYYVSGYCHTRRAERTFLLSRLHLAELPGYVKGAA